MFDISSWKHLRIPFSFYLLPVFIFAWAVAREVEISRLILVFITLHLFLYPSSNGYNSYFDKDEESIGGLKHPPKVTKGLYFLSMVFFLMALLVGLGINYEYSIMMLVYGLVSMAYSHPSVRLKKYPYISWVTAGYFQGYFTFCMAYAGLTGGGWGVYLKESVYIPGILTTIILMGSYPLTQVYQHREDQKRGDITLSLSLGILGTFVFASVWFIFSGIAFVSYFKWMGEIWAIWIFLGAMLPVILYFFTWFSLVRSNPTKYATYDWAMWMNRISAIALNFFFLYYLIEGH
ncbi:UbiA family prenyltransferase [Lunatibacter salilacus]|uniref:UbiA family prenyltransferase n=1 Tax=Lunatibacter salilacus TaxID=2483804 RepID=UPI00131C17BE|nr:UbiA family prenyltransferase [Lunatibacter salilacus]